MSTKREPISMSKRWLKSHGKEIVTVQGWADKMGYSDPVSFSEEFRRVFGCRPQPVLMAFRAREVVRLLRDGTLSNYEIAVDFHMGG